MSSFLNKINPRLLLTVCAISFGSCFQYGLHFGVLHSNSPLYRLFKFEVEYKEWLNSTNEEFETLNSWFNPFFIYGTIIGASLIGVFADKLGRKGAILYNNLFVFFAVILIGFAKPNNSYKMLLAGRFFSGLNIGLNSGLVPIYLIEISPVRWRGLIGSLYPLTIAIGNLIGQVLIQDIALRFHKTTLWLFVFMIIPAVFQLTVLPWCPESPKFLLIQKVNREPEVLKGLQWLREHESNLINTEVIEISLESDINAKFSYGQVFTNLSLRMPLIIGSFLMISQNVCGTHALSLYSSDVFKWVQIDDQIGLIILGAVTTLSTFVSLLLIENKGRKKLLFGGLVGMAITAFFLFAGLHANPGIPPDVLGDRQSMISLLKLLILLLFFGLFSISMGTIPGYFVSEISNQKSRSMTVSIASTFGWLTFWIFSSTGILLNIILKWIGLYVFLIYAALLLTSAGFVWFKVPETKNLTIGEVSYIFRQSSKLQDDVVATLV